MITVLRVRAVPPPAAPSSWRSKVPQRDRLALGLCRHCGRKRTHYEYRCDRCQDFERLRQRKRQRVYNARAHQKRRRRRHQERNRTYSKLLTNRLKKHGVLTTGVL